MNNAQNGRGWEWAGYLILFGIKTFNKMENFGTVEPTHGHDLHYVHWFNVISKLKFQSDFL